MREMSVNSQKIRRSSTGQFGMFSKYTRKEHNAQLKMIDKLFLDNITFTPQYKSINRK